MVVQLEERAFGILHSSGRNSMDLSHCHCNRCQPKDTMSTSVAFHRSYPLSASCSDVRFFANRDGRIAADYYAIVICVPKKLLYKSIQQLRAVTQASIELKWQSYPNLVDRPNCEARLGG
ncbi:hypothetical protein RHSIM_Rhsim09G0011300 [Rhododendron simsii]|uniref:ATP phosphoribosyltransferase n=1 Tax=Rhododendron simsii TaxID=118357 RepID=A0A834GDQ3_RHOSS|nr:hypothetical protein RHSIM_Rhsim09G0011300 [Rhododendron simsii]